MSSGTSYDWAYEQERERQRQSELRAELERLRVRHRQLERLQAALATQGVRAASAMVADVAQDATSAQLGFAVTEARTSLDALETRLETVVAQRTQERAARWAATPAMAVDLPPESSLGAALAEERARAEATALAAVARAATELVEAEAARCAEEDRAGLATVAAGVRDRRALLDLESQVTASIRRRRESEQAEQVRIELLTLAGELGQEERAALRGRIRAAADRDLAALRPEVLEVVAAERRRRARVEVTDKVLAALRAQGYEVGESFDDLLTDGPPVTLLTSSKTPDYGVRLTVDPGRERLQATVVRRDDVDGGDDRHAQKLVCDDLDQVQKDLMSGGLHLRTVIRRPVQEQVPTMAARHWPAVPAQVSDAAHGSDAAERAEQLRRAAELERQRRAHQQQKGRTQ